MKEADLYAPICDGAAKDGYRLFKIEDGGRMKKPFDIVGIDPSGTAVAIEVKVLECHIEMDKIMPTSIFETQQITWLSEWGIKGGLALVALYEEPERQLWLFQTHDECCWKRVLHSRKHTVLRRIDGLFRGWDNLDD